MDRKKLPTMLRRWNQFEMRLHDLLLITPDPVEQLEVLGIAIDMVTGRAPYHFAQNRLRELNPLEDGRADELCERIQSILAFGGYGHD